MLSRQFVRFASNSSRLQLVGVEGTYATALFDVALKDQQLNPVYKTLITLNDSIANDHKLNSAIHNPALSLKDRSIVVDTLVKVYKIDAKNPVRNFLTVLAENNRLAIFPGVVANYNRLNDHHNGVINATVTSVSQLDSKSFKRIEKALHQSKFVGSGKTLQLTNVIKPEIQGGVIVEIDDKTVDLSINSRIQKLNKLLNEDI